MRRFTRPLVVGALSFGLVAASAAGTTFTIGSVQAAPGTAEDAELVQTTGCDGTYAVEWLTTNGFVDGVTATRTAPDPDPTLEYCANAFYSIYIASNAEDGANPGQVDPAATWVLEWSGTTDATGNIDGSTHSVGTPNSGSIVFEAGMAVKIVIGPDAPPPL